MATKKGQTKKLYPLLFYVVVGSGIRDPGPRIRDGKKQVPG
jgi:hypothetical protein